MSQLPDPSNHQAAGEQRAYTPYEQVGGPPPRNAFAVAAFWVGIGSLVVNTFALVSIAAIVFGIMGVRRANVFARRGDQPLGRKLAVWGIVIALVGMLGTLLLKGLLF